MKPLPAFPYGAVYFRKSNPPQHDWERDYRQAARDGMNVFRHWFLWSAIQVAPGEWDWDDYDRQFELAAQHGLQTIVAECSHAAPEWAFRRLAHARYETADGRKVHSQIRNSSVTGGFPGLCLDNEDARGLAGHFLTELVHRYKHHPAMGAYDIWNECNLHSSAMPFCYCPATIATFRAWLQEKYGDVRTLGRAWHRHSYAEWDDVEPPRDAGIYPDYVDWVQFRIDNAHRLLQWRVDLVRALDPEHFISAHGVSDACLRRHVSGADDPWRAGALVDGYGYTGGCSYFDRDHGAWQRWLHADIARAGAQGRPFWAAERAAGPGGSGRGTAPRDNGRLPRGEDLRMADLTAMAGGVTGLFSSRWRPLLDGPLQDCYAYYALDGSPTVRSEMAAVIARWSNAPEQTALWRSRPIRGDIGIVVAPESQVYCELLHKSSELYTNAVRGAYRAFLHHNIQADWVPITHIDDYDLLYLPCPLSLKPETARALAAWVERGGRLVSEGCPGYFNERGRADTIQPGLGLDHLFGVRQEYVEWLPDLLENEASTFTVGDIAGVLNGWYLQTYQPTKGQAVGWYEDGRVAVVDNVFGQGKTRLVGTVPGLHGFKTGNAAVTAFFADTIFWAGKEPHVRSSDPRVWARLHAGDGGTFLWVINSGQSPSQVTLTLSSRWGPFDNGDVLWGDKTDKPTIAGQTITACVPPLDALVLRLT